jgi:hypothetical protein
MKTIADNNTAHVKVLGRDVFEGTNKKTVEGVQLIQYPLIWFEAQKKGNGITFGPGISYRAGTNPTGSELTFAAGQRISLVETILPVVTRYNVPMATPEEGTQVHIQVSDLIRSAKIIPIPSPYTSTLGRIRSPEASTPSVYITVLGYRNLVKGLAVGEEVTYSGSVDQELYPDYSTVSRYPYLISEISEEAGYSVAVTRYFYTEKEIKDAIEELANQSE